MWVDARIGTDREHEVQAEFLARHAAMEMAEAAGDYREGAYRINSGRIWMIGFFLP